MQGLFCFQNLAGSKVGFLLASPETTMGNKTYFKQKKMLRLLGGGIAGWLFGHKMTRSKMLFLRNKGKVAQRSP